MNPLATWLLLGLIIWLLLSVLTSLTVGRGINLADRRGQLDDDQPDDVTYVHTLAAGLRGDK